MKRNLIVLIILVVFVLSTYIGCSNSQQETKYIDEARQIAQTVSTPIWYCPNHGVEYQYSNDISVKIIEYSRVNGEPIFEITREQYCPKANWFDKYVSPIMYNEISTIKLAYKDEKSSFYYTNISLTELRNGILKW